jgi:hypothetical protein
MSLFHRKSTSGQHFVIIFDIGSSSVGGSFVSIGEGKTPEIIFATRRDIPFQEKLNFPRFLDLMVKTLEEMFVTMQKAGGGVKITQAFCVLASPWYASQTRLMRYNQQEPFVVTEKGLGKLIQKEIDLFRDSKLFVHSKVGDTMPEIMESKNIQMKLNGYEVRNPFGKRVSELEIALYISMIPANIYKSINESIMKFWHVPNAHFASFSFVAFDLIRGVFPDEASFLFMDISGEMTDISLAKDNVLLESISFPAGKNILTRALIEKMKTTPTAAISELNLYLENKSTKEHARQVEEALDAASREWLTYFEDALTQLSIEFPIPKTVFYTTDSNVVKWFERAIEQADFTKFSQEEGAFTVRSLGSEFLSKFVRAAEPDFQDPFLAVEAIFAKKFTFLTTK